MLQFEKIMCPALIICGENDDCIPSQHSQKIAELITNNGHDNPCELVTYPGAGHLIEPPYAPICIFSYQPPWGKFSGVAKGGQGGHAGGVRHTCLNLNFRQIFP